MSCEKVLKQLENTNKENIKLKKQYEDDKESYGRWLKRKNDWESKSGPYEKWKKYDGVNREFWASEFDGTCWAGENWGDANDWCHWAANKKGYDGENYWAKQWGWCYGRYGDFKCKKDDSTVKDQQNAYKDAIPEVDLDTNKYWLNKSEPTVTYLPVPDVKCCQEMVFKGIKASDISFDNNTQSCNITGKKIVKPDFKKKGSKDTKTSLTKTPVSKNNKVDEKNVSSNYIMYIMYIIIFIIILILLGGGVYIMKERGYIKF